MTKSLPLDHHASIGKQAGFMKSEMLHSQDQTEQRSESISDEQLMLPYCDGSVAAFEQLYTRHKSALLRFFIRQSSDRQVAEELFQDVWMKLVNARQNYQSSAKFTTYLYRVAHNRLIDHYRHKSSAHYQLQATGDQQQIVDMAGDQSDTLDELVAQQQTERLQYAINDLPREQREAFILQQETSLSLADIAEITSTSRETVKSRLRYAMTKLRQAMGVE